MPDSCGHGFTGVGASIGFTGDRLRSIGQLGQLVGYLGPHLSDVVCHNGFSSSTL
jgi:hypothetical protein